MISDSGNNRVEAVYTSDSPLRRPGRLLRDMLRDISESRELALRLFLRNVKSKYRQTMFGYVWAFLPPVVTTVVFVFLNSQKIINVGGNRYYLTCLRPDWDLTVARVFGCEQQPAQGDELFENFPVKNKFPP